MQQVVDAVELAGEVADIGATPCPPEERAAALLEPLHRVLPFDGAWLMLRDDALGEHRSLVSTGWDRRTATYLDGQVVVDEIEQLGLGRSPAPMRVADVPFPVEQLQTWSECLLPAGLREALGMSLFAPGGRQVGFLGLFTGSAVAPSESARDLLAALGPMLARAVDPLRSVAAVASTVRAATNAVILTRRGDVTAMPGLPGHAALRPGSPVLAAARALIEGPQISFLLPAPGADGGFLRVTVLAVPEGAPHHLVVIVVLSPGGDLHGLTRRELEVLGLMVAGHHNAEAARRLGVRPRTIATHVEHILVKLNADTRALAAVRAQRLGLYVPPALLAATA